MKSLLLALVATLLVGATAAINADPPVKRHSALVALGFSDAVLSTIQRSFNSAASSGSPGIKQVKLELLTAQQLRATVMLAVGEPVMGEFTRGLHVKVTPDKGDAYLGSVENYVKPTPSEGSIRYQIQLDNSRESRWVPAAWCQIAIQ